MQEKKNNIKVYLTIFFLLFILGLYHTQVNPPVPIKNKKPTPIKLINADLEEVNEKVFDGNMVYSGNVIAEHETSSLKADSIIYFQDRNFIEARGNINFKDKDTYLVCKRLTYDANTKTAVAYDDVKLTSPDQIIETQELIYDANSDVAYFDNWGTIYKGENITKTKIGKYFVKDKRIELGANSTLESPDYTILGTDIKYNTQSGLAIFKNFTEIINKKDPTIYIIGTQGTYNTKTKESFLKKDGVVHYQGKILSADDLYFNEITGYGKGIKNVKLEEPKEKRYLMGEYGEVFQFKDSAIVTGRPYMVKAFTKDSLYMHSDTIIAIQDKNKKSTIRGYHNGRLFKSNMSGKSDSLVYHEGASRLDFYKKPIFWATGGRQLISDTLSVYLNPQTQAIDSVYGRENAFVISKVDSLSPKLEFNQAKGRKLYAYFENDKIHFIDLKGNAESIAYVEEESKKTGKKERTGIAISICGILQGEFVNEELDIVSCQLDAQSKIYPESKLPENQRFLPQFNWRGKERLRKWNDIFPDIFPDQGIDSADNIDVSIQKSEVEPISN
ncbi:organic solvent tolerance protein OstA [Apibacter muscae]|uniref:OstA-like protein n=1 Tax=Apibacter muscae TaxID=2509004 RepID=UPI0011AD2BA4|nr:OstA-like protein [Apibacter muscae]TWP23492.1 organic solvent tolerance protein OstA [Apibacter muscae]